MLRWTLDMTDWKMFKACLGSSTDAEFFGEVNEHET
jgi:hypothetical protein